ncbi:hypothetical protein IFY90_004256 [Salmonella enterica]|nr:hypothetical protein [Salmonella enterica]
MNEFINPADPVTSPNAKQIIAKFMARIESVRGNNQQTENTAPTQEVTPEQGQEQQETKVSDMQRYLAPIKMDKFNEQSYSDSHHEVFTDNLVNDPVYEKIEPMIEAFSNTLKQGIASGAISPERAEDEKNNFMRNVIYPIVHEAHGPHSESHKSSLMAKTSSKEIPEFVRQVTGAK